MVLGNSTIASYVVDEPLALTYLHLHLTPSQSRIFLVIDVGGGTTDVSLVDFTHSAS